MLELHLVNFFKLGIERLLCAYVGVLIVNMLLMPELLVPTIKDLLLYVALSCIRFLLGVAVHCIQVRKAVRSLLVTLSLEGSPTLKPCLLITDEAHMRVL